MEARGIGMGGTRRHHRAGLSMTITVVLGLAALVALSGPAAAAGLVDGGFESGTLAGPYPTAPAPPSVGFWTRTSDDSHLVSPPAIVRTGQWALEVDTRSSSIGSAIYQDFDSGALSYLWTTWVYPSEGTNVAEVVYNWDRGSQGRAEPGTFMMFTPSETRFSGWNGNAIFPAVPAGAWHELTVRANRCTRTQEVRLDGALWGVVDAGTAPPAGIGTMILGDVAFNALQGLYHYDDISFELFDCSAPPSRPCPLSHGFWKNHAGKWPVDSLTLGDETYTRADLLTLLGAPSRGDASVILARQLIAAKLNVANGSDPAPVQQTILDADAVLAPVAGRLPYGIPPSSATGRTMTALAGILDDYNNGRLTPDCDGCREGDGEEGDHDGEHEHEDDECDDDDDGGRDDHDDDDPGDCDRRCGDGDDPEHGKDGDRSVPGPPPLGHGLGLAAILGLLGFPWIGAGARRGRNRGPV